jgi:hypothetical protein
METLRENLWTKLDNVELSRLILKNIRLYTQNDINISKNSCLNQFKR